MTYLYDIAVPNDAAAERILGAVFIKRLPLRKLAVALGWNEDDLEVVIRAMQKNDLITFVPRMSGPEVQITYQGREFLNARR